ncbi:hypothetical protein IWX47DRAFT_544127 [Phyllosticta citricarpa]|uniref:C2H2-type domain-containing protein n=1 Tax=Phyllosticta citricarpa TaxID=55181 RepID=A0ABR1M5S9_9PEZI
MPTQFPTSCESSWSQPQPDTEASPKIEPHKRDGTRSRLLPGNLHGWFDSRDLPPFFGASDLESPVPLRKPGLDYGLELNYDHEKTAEGLHRHPRVKSSPIGHGKGFRMMSDAPQNAGLGHLPTPNPSPDMGQGIPPVDATESQDRFLRKHRQTFKEAEGKNVSNVNSPDPQQKRIFAEWPVSRFSRWRRPVTKSVLRTPKYDAGGNESAGEPVASNFDARDPSIDLFRAGDGFFSQSFSPRPPSNDGSMRVETSTPPMANSNWDIAKQMTLANTNVGRSPSRSHPHQMLGISTKEIAGRIFTDFETDLFYEEDQSEYEDSSEGTSESDGSPSCESNIDNSPIKLESGDEIQNEQETSAHRSLLKQWQELATSRGSTSQSPASGNHGARIPSTSTTSNKRGRESSKGQKRRNNDEGDGSGGKKRRDNNVLDSSSSENTEKKLACPYHKRSRGGTPKAPSCVYPGFSSVSRLKEHLHRVHRRPTACPRCYARFESQDGLDTHINQPTRCLEARYHQNIEGFGVDQERQLRCKKRVAGVKSEEEKWRAIYRILFPDDAEIPSPYQDSGDSTASRPIDFSRWEQTLLDELPRIFRQTLEDTLNRDMQAIEQTLRNQVPGIIRNLREQLFAAFVSDTQGPIQDLTPFEDSQADQRQHSTGPRLETVGSETNRLSGGLPTADQTPEALEIRMGSTLELHTAPVDLVPQPLTIDGVSIRADEVNFNWANAPATQTQNPSLNSTSESTGLGNNDNTPITPPDDPADARLLKNSGALQPTRPFSRFGGCGSFQNDLNLSPEVIRTPSELPEHSIQSSTQAVTNTTQEASAAASRSLLPF